MRKKIVAVIGNKKIEPDGIRYRLAYETGKLLVDNGYRVQSGGLGGVMEAVFAGRMLQRIIVRETRSRWCPLSTRRRRTSMRTSSYRRGWT